MILSQCFLTPGGVCMSGKTCNSKSPTSRGICVSGKKSNSEFQKFAATCISSSWKSRESLKSCLPRGTRPLQLSSPSTSFLCVEERLSYAVPKLSNQRRGSTQPPRAMGIFNFKYPPMTKRPRFWWRFLACIPYILPVHETWVYVETAYHLHHFFESFAYWTRPFFRSLGRLPRWSLICYFIFGYLGIVRRKEWPHFLRFHLAQGLLIEITLQITGTIFCRWMPWAVYWGKIGQHFWTAFAFAHLFTCLECIRCALTGYYADIPFLSDAAYIQIPYE